MPMGSKSDSAEVAQAYNATSTSGVQRYLKSVTGDRTTDEKRAAASRAASKSRAEAEAQLSHSQTEVVTVFGGQAAYDAWKVWYDNQGQRSADHIALARRLSAYVVKSFTPPSFGASIGQTEQTGAPANKTVDDMKSAGTMESAQITLVSTLQDDLHFSLSFLYQLANPGAPVIGAGGASLPTVVTPRLFPEAVWPDLGPTKRTLSIIDMGARMNPGDTKIEPNQPATKAFAKYFASTPVGIHKLHDPYITAVNFSEYSYGGEAFLEATVTLSPSTSNYSFYSYETYATSYPEGGDTRYGRYSGLKNKGPNSKVSQLQRLVTEAYSKYPNFDLKVHDNPLTQFPGVAIENHIAARTKQKRERLMGLANKVMAKANAQQVGHNPAAPNPRTGMLYPLLQNKTQELAAAAAQRQAQEDANLAAHDQRVAEGEANMAAQSEAIRQEALGREQFRLDQEDALDTIGSDYDALREQQLISEDADWIIRRDSQEMAGQQRMQDMRNRYAAQGGSAQDVLARRIARLSGNQSSSGVDVSNFGQDE